MAKGTHGFVGFRLRDAREARGLSAASLADCIGVSRQSVSQYERGTQSPAPDVLGTIASTLNFLPHRFMLDGDEMKLGTVYYRSMASATKSARVRAEKRLGWMLEVLNLIYDQVEFPEVSFPLWTFPSDPSEISFADVELAAHQLRDFWGLGHGQLGNIVWLLESRGAIVARHELLADTLDAFSIWSEHFGRPIIVIGADKESACRSRFDAAHELAHLILHRDIDPARLNDDSDFEMMEQQAHRFAAAFLLPEAAFAADLYSATLDAMLSLKHKWKVAISAMIQRAFHLDLITPTERQRLFIGMSRRKWRKREPLDSEIPIEQPKVLRRAIEKLIEAGNFSPDDFSGQLGLPEKDLEQTLCLQEGFLRNPAEENDPTEPRIISFRMRHAK